ncbi:hypothetical protein AB0D49_15495 [Streptomyces sp. NPDC048290]|uniref:hypothetical protein n=1 Tax=Streptomyces sp. NPDC048290 TaxID=3155811 RepID=UPI00342C783A
MAIELTDRALDQVAGGSEEEYLDPDGLIYVEVPRTYGEIPRDYGVPAGGIYQSSDGGQTWQ